MIISRTPLRISFFGGGTDVPFVFNQIGGAVFTSTFSKFIYIMLNVKDPDFGRGISAKYSEIESVEHPRYIKHPIMRQVCLNYGLNNLDVSVSSDLPGGSGLGSSSSFTVGFLNCVHGLQNSESTVTKFELAEEACKIEINDLNEPIGKQDAFAASLGGLRGFVFTADNQVSTIESKLDAAQISELELSLRLVRIGAFRKTSEMLSRQFTQFKIDPKQIVKYEKLSQQAHWAMQITKLDLYEFGENLLEAWSIKKSLSPIISNVEIENLMQIGMKSGAVGGKLLGAGGSGYLLFIVPEEMHDQFDIQMTDYNPRRINFDFEGSKILQNLRQ